MVGVEGEQASDERVLLQVLERSYQDYLETNPEGSRHIEIYRAYEDEDCVTFESVSYTHLSEHHYVVYGKRNR